MRNQYAIITLGVLLAAAAAPAAASAPARTRTPAADAYSVEVGFGLEVGSDWIRLDGKLRFDGSGDTGGAGDVHTVPVALVPNVVGQVHTGVVLIRTLRATAACVARAWLREWVSGPHGVKGH